MKQNENYDYKTFYKERLHKPRRTERAEMEEIASNFRQLAEEHDFQSLELIRQLSKLLLDESDRDRALYMLMIFEKLLRADKSCLDLIFAITKLF